MHLKKIRVNEEKEWNDKLKSAYEKHLTEQIALEIEALET